MITQEKAYEVRAQFFKAILDKFRDAPNEMDRFLNQEKYYIKPLDKEIYSNVEYGDLIIPVEGEFFGYPFKIWYSLWHIGERVKVGIMLKEMPLQEALSGDHYKEINLIWGQNITPNVDGAHSVLLYEWEFECPNFFESFVFQEKFILGMRHMHFRVMRIVHDRFNHIFNDAQILQDDDVSNLS